MGASKILGFAVRAQNEASQVFDDVADSLSGVQEAAVDAAKETEHFGSKLGAAADFGGNAEQALRGVSDLTGVLSEQFRVSLGPLDAYAGALMDVGGGVEAALKGGPAVVAQLKALPAALGPAIAGTWAHVAALTAQAAAFIVANAPILLLIAGIALLAGGIVLLVKNWDTITEKVPILGTAVEAVKGVVIEAKDKVVGAFQAVVDWLQNNWPLVAAIISGPFAPLVLLATDAFGVRSALTGAFADALQAIKELAGTAWEAGKTMGTGLKDGIIEGIKGTVAIGGSILDGVLDAIKYLINSGIQAINDLIPNNLSFSVGAFGVEKSVTIDLPDNPIPRLAAGGIVTRPTVALLGEAGPEAVVPLSGPNARGVGANVTIIVQALDGPSVREWLRAGGAELIADEVGRRAAFA